MIKIAMIMGKGVDGCGVTRIAREMQIWANKSSNHDFTVFSYEERKFGRGAGHEMDYVGFVENEILEIKERLEEFDIVIFNSYPSNRQSKSSINAFYDHLVKGLKNPIKVAMMHELNKTNIDKIPYVVGIMNHSDIIYNFSEKTWFSNTMSELLPSKVIGKRMKKFTMWFNFDEMEMNYRNKFPLKNRKNKLIYVGRWTTMKDPRRLLDLAPVMKHYDPNFEFELLGIERSIGAKCDIFDHPNCLDMTGKKQIGPVDGVPVFGPYVREEGMKKLCESIFGASFYRMPKSPEGYGDRMEYTQMEIIATGTIPVFDKHWGENNRTKDGRRYIDIPYSAIYSDKEDLEGTAKQLLEVENDPNIQEKIRKTSFEIIKKEFDVDVVLPEMFEDILRIGKDKNKFTSDNEVIRAITNNEEFITLFDEYCSKGEIPVLGIRELTENIFCIIKGKKEIEIKKWKKVNKQSKNNDEVISLEGFFS